MKIGFEDMSDQKVASNKYSKSATLFGPACMHMTSALPTLTSSSIYVGTRRADVIAVSQYLRYTITNESTLYLWV